MTGALKFRESISEMSRSDKHAVRSNLTVLLQHLLKRDCVKGTILRNNQRKWEDEIEESRRRLLGLVTKHPGLKAEFRDISLPSIYADALKTVEKEYEALPFRHSSPYTLQQVVGSRVWRQLNE
jgi:Domain of unknown function DUF29